ncbi:STAS domain-containing protein [Streptomyces sp. NPDC000987]|uniref:STAS domain-containing protein n=1 Tax=unclassified Streptomyces TaxID=2593676 RepID=UPI002D77DDB0|nr:STAS domain-containing protein [Streptomyces sp. H51]
MTISQQPSFELTVEHGPDAAVVRVDGELDYDTHAELVDAVTSLLTPPEAAPALLRLDFTGLRHIDSSGLAALLLIRRRTDRKGVRLLLEKRPALLDRVLEMTGTFDHLVAPAQDAQDIGGQGRPGTG